MYIHSMFDSVYIRLSVYTDVHLCSFIFACESDHIHKVFLACESDHIHKHFLKSILLDLIVDFYL